jgi:hypothetical protein
MVVSREVCPASQLDVSSGSFQRLLVDESETVRNQMGKHNRL